MSYLKYKIIKIHQPVFFGPMGVKFSDRGQALNPESLLNAVTAFKPTVKFSDNTARVTS